MRALLISAALVASLLVVAVPSSAHPEDCTWILNCNFENAPPSCVGSWTGTIHYHLAGYSFTIHYCAYWGPEP